MKAAFLIGAVFFFVFVSGVCGQAPAWEWAKSAGGNAWDRSTAICTDANGNIYSIGEFDSNTFTIGNIQLWKGGYYDSFIIKFNSSGDILWAQNIGGGYSRAITSDPFGNIFITGYFQGSIYLGNTSLTCAGLGVGFFIAKYDSSGNVLWAKSAGGTTIDQGWGVTTDKNGNAYVTGFFSSASINFGSVTLINTGSNDTFIAKYDTSGNVIWVRSSGGNSNDYGYAIAIDANSNAFVSGEFLGATVMFGTTTLTNAGSYDVFIAKYDSSGNMLWVNSIGGNNDDECGYSIATDSNGDVYIGGEFLSPTMTLGSITLINSGSYDSFIAKCDASGNFLWAKNIIGTNSDIIFGIASDLAGNCYVTGGFGSSSITLGSVTLMNSDTSGSSDIFIAELNGAGNVLWAQRADGKDSEGGVAVTTNKSSDVYIAGSFGSDTLIFGNNFITKSNDYKSDVFIAKLSYSVNINEDVLSNTLTIYPNPTHNKLYIAYNVTINHLTLTDLTGRHVLEKTFPSTVGENKIDIDVSALAKGVYIVTVGDGEREMRGKVVVE